MKRNKILSAIGAAAVVLCGVVGALEAFAATSQGKFKTFASTDAASGESGLTSRVYDMPPDQTAQVAAAVIARMPNWSLVRSRHDQGTVEAQVTNGLGLFRDSVVVQVLPDGRNARVTVASQSRIEDGVTGANVRNIRALQAAMDDRLPPAI